MDHPSRRVCPVCNSSTSRRRWGQTDDENSDKSESNQPAGSDSGLPINTETDVNGFQLLVPENPPVIMDLVPYKGGSDSMNHGPVVCPCLCISCVRPSVVDEDTETRAGPSKVTNDTKTRPFNSCMFTIRQKIFLNQAAALLVQENPSSELAPMSRLIVAVTSAIFRACTTPNIRDYLALLPPEEEAVGDAAANVSDHSMFVIVPDDEHEPFRIYKDEIYKNDPTVLDVMTELGLTVNEKLRESCARLFANRGDEPTGCGDASSGEDDAD